MGIQDCPHKLLFASYEIHDKFRWHDPCKLQVCYEKK